MYVKTKADDDGLESLWLGTYRTYCRVIRHRQTNEFINLPSPL